MRFIFPLASYLLKDFVGAPDERCCWRQTTESQPGKSKQEMRKATYQRIQGKRYTYQIRYDHAGYEVSRNGRIKKIGLVPKTPDEPYLTRDEAIDQGLFTAEIDIEGLIGMDE